jgi:hypothetical protein
MEENKPIKKATAKKTTAKKAAPKKEAPKPQAESKPDKVAVFCSGRLFHPALGRLDMGYNIVDSHAAEEWMKISKKVREATPQEVASAYGV